MKGLRLLPLLLVACTAAPAPTPVRPPDPARGEVLGVLAVTVNSSTPGVPLETRFLKAAELNSLSPQSFDVQNPSSVLSVCSGLVSYVDDTSVSPPVRYFTGLFKFDNTLASSLTNLTFHALNTASNLNGTAVLNVRRADGTVLTDPSVAQRMRPTHAMTLGGGGAQVNPALAHLQVFTPEETLEVQQKFASAFPSTGGSVLEYGYVAESLGGTRTLAASSGGTACSAGNPSSGQVAFSYAYPYQSTDTAQSVPYQFSLRFVLTVDSVTSTTQSLEEQSEAGNVAFYERVNSLSSIETSALVRILGGSSFTTFSPYNQIPVPVQYACGALQADPTRAPTAPAVDTFSRQIGASPASSDQSFKTVPQDTAFRFDFTKPLPTSTASNLHLLSSFRVLLPATYAPNGSSVTVTPTLRLLPGEVVKVNAVPPLKLCLASYVVFASARGEALLGPQRTFPVGLAPLTTALGDLNGDGNLDVVVAHRGLSTVSVLLGDGQGGLVSASGISVHQRPGNIRMGDLNGDGNLDELSTNYAANNVSVLLGDGRGVFSASAFVPVGRGPRGVTLGDLNGDGTLDAVVANTDDNTLSVLLNTDFGGTLDFGNPSSSVTVPPHTRLSSATAGSYTVEAWVRLPSGLSTTDDAHHRILTHNPNTEPDPDPDNPEPIPFSLFVHNGRLGASLCDRASFGPGVCDPDVLLSPVGTTYTDGQWHHLAFVRQVPSVAPGQFPSQAQLTLYVDGVQAAQTTARNNQNMRTIRPLVMGNPGDGLGFGGQLNEVRVWNVARTAQEIAHNRNGALYAPYPSSLAAYFKLDSTSGTTAIDEITPGANGTLSSGFPTNPWVLR